MFFVSEYIPEDLLKQMLHNVLLLIMSPSREIVDAALSYVKMFVTLGTSVVTASVSSIVSIYCGSKVCITNVSVAQN